MVKFPSYHAMTAKLLAMADAQNLCRVHVDIQVCDSATERQHRFSTYMVLYMYIYIYMRSIWSLQ